MIMWCIRCDVDSRIKDENGFKKLFLLYFYLLSITVMFTENKADNTE